MGHILRRNCFLKYVIEGWVEVTGRRRRRRKQHWMTFKKDLILTLTEEALDLTPWRTRFGRCYGPDAGQTTEMRWNENEGNWETLRLRYSKSCWKHKL